MNTYFKHELRMARKQEEAPLHLLTSMCHNEWLAIGFNIATTVVTIAFAVTLHLFVVHNQQVEKLAKIKNPYDGFMSVTFWSTVGFAVALTALVIYQVIHRLRTSRKI